MAPSTLTWGLFGFLLATAACAAASEWSNWRFPFNQQQQAPAARAARRSEGLLVVGSDLEREQLQPPQVNLFNGNTLASSQIPAILLFDKVDRDLFRCIEPTRELYRNFIAHFNRTFYGDSTEELDRWNLFTNTLKRTILFNRVIQNELSNRTNHEAKPASIRNYHFITPVSYNDHFYENDQQLGAATSRNRNLQFNLWYADITDCELGLIKYHIFEIFYMIDRGDLATAYAAAISNDNSGYLPLLDADGFEQLANILLVRLYDRFKGDGKMDQLFQWPLYIKKLAAYAYNRAQAMDPDFKSKLPLLTFAYPSYFKDLKYNWPAINRTIDNLKAHEQHEKFNKLLNRQFSSLQERNKRLVVYRQRLSLINLLNEEDSSKAWNVTIEPEWTRASSRNSPYDQTQSYGLSEKLLSNSAGQDLLNGPANLFKPTQFSDLTDAEFVAFLTNDYSLVGNDEQTINFIERNFPIRPLDEQFRQELALELELRRGASSLLAASQGKSSEELKLQRAQSLRLARNVVEELISDVGLPIGSVAQSNLEEQQYLSTFMTVGRFFSKQYLVKARGSTGRFESTDSEQVEERGRRYERFKLNLGRFKAWFIKEGWLSLSDEQQVALLRLADLSWQDIKLTMFRLCCLNKESIAQLSAKNVTIQYLASQRFMCQESSLTQTSGCLSENPEQCQDSESAELAALELYYYYSVHFNKHHSNARDFERRFAIFRNNVAQIKRHSCTRGLTLFKSLADKRPFDYLSNVDTLDPRRSYTDDINLDRFEFFSVPKLDALSTEWLIREGERSAVLSQAYKQRNSGPLTRAGLSYRREPFFQSLLDANKQVRIIEPLNNPKLTNADLAHNKDSTSLRLQPRIYELVMQRYRQCVKTVSNKDLPTGYLSQQCRSGGALQDQAVELSLNGLPESQYNSQASLQLQTQDPCAIYRLGLGSWNEGLIKQDDLAPRLIQAAKC